MEYVSLSEWLSDIVKESNQEKSNLNSILLIDVWEYILEYTHISSPKWRLGTFHSILIKNRILEISNKNLGVWYGHYWCLSPTPWVKTYWYGLRGLECEFFPRVSSHNYKIILNYINNNDLTYFGYDDLNCPFALIETFPDWCSHIIKEIYSLPDISLRQVANIHYGY
tara:strand:+ start:244 stop:747 length:504 start_codon:yes stop_codon:yes gene_type:complete